MTYDPKRCPNCGKPVGRTQGGFPRTFCSRKCNQESLRRTITAQEYSRIRAEEWREPCPERRRS